MKNSYFYSNADIKQMKELIRTGEPLIAIAEREHSRFNTTQTGFYFKLMTVARNTTKVREWQGPKLRRTKSAKVAEKVNSVEKSIETKMPEGFTFEGTPKKVTFCVDHFRVYF